MNRKDIHLIRAAQVKPFVNTALRLGAPVAKLARQAGLDLQSVNEGKGVIGEYSAWDFIALASRHLECEHFGYRVALDHPVNHSGQLGGLPIMQSSDLNGILQWFIQAVTAESDNSDYRLITRHSSETWFSRSIPWRHEADWINEQYVLSFIIQIIRLCAPGDWLPKRIRIATRLQPVRVPAEWASVAFEWGQQNTELLINNEFLSAAPRFPANIQLSAVSGRAQNTLLIQDLVDRQIWSGQIGIRLAAMELGMSTATLKRRLASAQTSYSTVLNERRLQHARTLLSESGMSISHIAHTLGYTAVSNFSRAFKQQAGLAPTVYRKTENRVEPD